MQDLPKDVSWPCRPRPLTAASSQTTRRARGQRFVAQFDFAEIQKSNLADGWKNFPWLGRLLLFCPIDYRWGRSIEDQACSSEMLITASHECLVRQTPPVEFRDLQHHLFKTRGSPPAQCQAVVSISAAHFLSSLTVFRDALDADQGIDLTMS
jgi:hypothetical protein